MFEYERARRKEESVEQSMGPVMCDPRSLIEGLNPQQEEAVKYYGQALLIGAGAGSGKTRVLTRRIAWLLAHGFWASSILAITFTNKAAAEMRERLVTLVGPEAEHMWISTFHSACVRILRRDGKEIGLKSGFSIYDTADSERLVKLIAADLNIDTKRYTPRMLLGKISDCKNALVSWKDQLKKANCDYIPGQRGYQVSAGDVDELVAVVYAEYQHRLALANAVDFDDLIMRTVELLQTCPQVSEYYRHRFRYIFVDEYQDTNHAQYVLVRELSGIDSDEQPDPQARGAGRVGPSWITVVGDSDQSIYAFRGADIRNIQDFEQDFPNAKTIMLEQNYRSTQTILDAANAVIAKNENRKPKKLWTALGQGDKIVGYAADNAQQEAGWIANEIARIHTEEDVAYRDIAIMYRANAQSRSLEEAMINANLPYQLVGGTKFYERREVKDAIAYLQAIVNPADNVNVRRILNVPKRGLGARAEGLVAGYADAHGLTFFESIEHMDQIEGMTGRTTKPLGAFRDLMHELADFAKEHDSKPSEVVAEVLDKKRSSGGIATFRGSAGCFACGQSFPVAVRGRRIRTEHAGCHVGRFSGDHGIGRRLGSVAGRGRGFRQGHDDDLAYGQRFGISVCVSYGYGTGYVPAPACHGGHQRAVRGASSGIRGHHPCEASAVCDPCGGACPMGAGQ